jgi:glycine/sarcosine N-methyltransferase
MGMAAKTSPKPARTPRKRGTRKIITERYNIAQPELLLTEKEYADGLAEYFDLLFPDTVVEQIYKPFFTMMVNKHGIRSVCDLACRSGQTLKMLSKMGLKKMCGVDISSGMIRRAKKKTDKKVQYFISELAKAPNVVGSRTFDMVICTKDALPVVLDDEALINFFKSIRNILTDKGVMILELMNYEKVWRNKERFMPVMDRSLAKTPRLFFFMNDFHEELIVRNLMHLEKEKEEWHLKPLSIPARPIVPAEVEFFLEEAKYSKWAFLGNYSGKPFADMESTHLIVIARK